MDEIEYSKIKKLHSRNYLLSLVITGLVIGVSYMLSKMVLKETSQSFTKLLAIGAFINLFILWFIRMSAQREVIADFNGDKLKRYEKVMNYSQGYARKLQKFFLLLFFEIIAVTIIFLSFGIY